MARVRVSGGRRRRRRDDKCLRYVQMAIEELVGEIRAKFIHVAVATDDVPSKHLSSRHNRATKSKRLTTPGDRGHSNA